jgi:tellurite resistance protein
MKEDELPMQLTHARLEHLRDQLRARGQRQSMVMPSTKSSQDLVMAMAVVEEYGALCEVMYLMMAADRRVLDVEREVLRGALDVLSGDTVRTWHMDAMIDAAARRIAEEGADVRLKKLMEILREDPVRAETTIVLAAAVAAADNRIVPEEHALLAKLFEGLGISEERANGLLEVLDVAADRAAKK